LSFANLLCFLKKYLITWWLTPNRSAIFRIDSPCLCRLSALLSSINVGLRPLPGLAPPFTVAPLLLLVRQPFDTLAVV